MRTLIRRIVPLGVRRPVGIALYRVYARGRKLIRELIGRLPFLVARDVVYDERFYDKGDPMKRESYAQFARALFELCSPRAVVDVGCGSGLMLREFARLGVAVVGVEGSRAAIERSGLGDRVVRANLERGVPDLGRFDVCLCIEVAEHLSSRSGVALVDGLVRLSDVIVFTAAQPGQRGTVHMNLRPMSYWHRLFEDRQFSVSPLHDALLRAIADTPEPRFLHENLVVFERSPGRRANEDRT